MKCFITSLTILIFGLLELVAGRGLFQLRGESPDDSEEGFQEEAGDSDTNRLENRFQEGSYRKDGYGGAFMHHHNHTKQQKHSEFVYEDFTPGERCNRKWVGTWPFCDKEWCPVGYAKINESRRDTGQCSGSNGGKCTRGFGIQPCWKFWRKTGKKVLCQRCVKIPKVDLGNETTTPAAAEVTSAAASYATKSVIHTTSTASAGGTNTTNRFNESVAAITSVAASATTIIAYTTITRYTLSTGHATNEVNATGAVKVALAAEKNGTGEFITSFTTLTTTLTPTLATRIMAHTAINDDTRVGGDDENATNVTLALDTRNFAERTRM